MKKIITEQIEVYLTKKQVKFLLGMNGAELKHVFERDDNVVFIFRKIKE